MSRNVKQLYEASVETQIKVWDNEIEHLDSCADLRVAQFEDKYYTLIKRLRQDESDVKAQLAALIDAGEDEESIAALRVQLACAADKLKFDLKQAGEEIGVS